MRAELHTPLCELLGVTYPILSVGFGDGASPELAAAVSNAGGFGVLGIAGGAAASADPGQIQSRIAGVRELTDRPFGFNFLIVESSPEDRAVIREAINAAVSQGCAAVVLFWGNPAPYVGLAHEHGAKVLLQVGSVDEAKAAVAAGVDAVIAQGIEAGGHVRGKTSIWELLPATVQAIQPIPVLASGGIGDGAGIARALELGAQGVSLGTRFVASNEAWFHPVYKQRIVESTAADTVLSDLYDLWWPDAPHRTLRNRTFADWEAAGRPPSGKRPGEDSIIGKRRLRSGTPQDWPRYAVGLMPPTFEGDLDYAAMLVGESCSAVNEILPAGEIVRQLARDTEKALAAAATRA
jgi:NAD(P)H-dependent flavin oxidoreductase YrpB (nitropropane dioxygenase family)